MAARIDDDFMTAEYDGRVIATARCGSHAAAEGQDAWIVSSGPRRLFTRNQAITARTTRSGAEAVSASRPGRLGCRLSGSRGLLQAVGVGAVEGAERDDDPEEDLAGAD